MSSEHGMSAEQESSHVDPGDEILSKEQFATPEDTQQLTESKVHPAFQDCDEEEDQQEGDCCYRCLNSNKCCRAWPRCCACVVGVVLPLWFLILLSLFFGVGLAALEANEEVAANDEILQDRLAAGLLAEITLNFTKLVPRLCLAAYVLQNDTTALEIATNYLDTQDFGDGIVRISTDYNADIEPQVEQSPLIISNWTDFNEFMTACGDDMKERMDTLVNNLVEASRNTAASLSFNWIRCYPGASGIGNGGFDTFQASLGPRNEEIDTTFDAQEELYTELWEQDFERIRKEKATLAIADDNLTPAEVENTYRTALTQASGKSTCSLNGPGSAWFWFTVQTTVGYGNQAPSTKGGRAMVFTLGFFSILAFGAILGFAGYIIAVMVDDLVSRIPYVGDRYGNRLHVVMWFILTYMWMFVIGSYTRDWKLDQTGEEIDYGDGYWFAYISTTTVGLGDIFLEPEVFRSSDLLTFPLLFLTGFVFFSAFIGKLIDLSSNGPHKKGVLDALKERLAKTDIVAMDDSAPEESDLAQE